MHGTVEISAAETQVPAGSAAAFYASARGAAAIAVLRERMAAFWPDLRGQCVLGLGYAEPYLPLWQE